MGTSWTQEIRISWRRHYTTLRIEARSRNGAKPLA
jgi:hypothetical protein